MNFNKTLFGMYAVPFFVIVLFTGLSVGYVGYSQVQDLSIELTTKEFQKNAEILNSEISMFFHIAKHVNESQIVYLQDYRSPTEILNSNTPKALLSELQTHEPVASVQYADPNNFSIAVAKNVFNVPYSYAEIGTNPAKPTGAKVYKVDENFNYDKNAPLLDTVGYDVRLRPWFQAGMKSTTPFWTEIYPWVSEAGEVGLDYIYPVVREGKTTAVLASSVTLGNIKNFLNDLLYASPLSHVYILEKNGNVVSGTDINSPVRVLENNELERISANNSESVYLKSVYEDISLKGGVVEALKKPYFETVVDGEGYYYSVSRYTEDSTLEWYVVSLLRKNVVLARIQSTNQAMMAISFAIVLASILLAFLVSQRVTRPITKLSKAAHDFEGKGVPASLEKEKFGTVELDELAQSFVRMSKKIEGQIVTLENQEDVLTLENEKLSKTIEYIGEAILVLDKDLNVVLMNKVAEKMTGNPIAFSQGKHFDEICELQGMHSKTTKVPGFITKALDTGAIQVEDEVYSVISKRGAKIPAICLASPILQEDGTVYGVVVVIRDITEEQQISRTKGDIVSIASHQLRTPLSIVKWNSELLLSQRTGDKITQRERTYIEEISAAIEQMIEMVDNLLKASQFELGVFRIKPEELKVKSIISQALNYCKEVTERANLEVITKIGKGAQTYLADKELFNMIAQNLVTNAIKYSRDGGKVTISAEITDKHFVFEVKDQGIGIPEEEKEKLFTKLYRGSEARKVNPNGSGLGLYIVKLITEKVHGFIKVQSDLGVGSTFTVLLPKQGMK